MRHPPYGFDIYLVNDKTIRKEDGANYFDLLRKAELYSRCAWIVRDCIWEAKLARTFDFDKQDIIDFTKLSKPAM